MDCLSPFGIVEAMDIDIADSPITETESEALLAKNLCEVFTLKSNLVKKAEDTTTESCRRKSFKRMMLSQGEPIASSSTTCNKNAAVYWYLRDIIKNSSSQKPLLDVPNRPSEKPKRSSQITCMDFNEDGELLAAGDAGGQVVVYHRNSHYFKPSSLLNDGRYHSLVAFDAHDEVFDVMTSSVGESNVTQLKWLRNGKTRSDFLLSSGYKTVKLWKVEQKQKLQYDTDALNSSINGHELTLPKVINKEWQVASSLRATFGTPNTYEVNSVSLNSDQETFLSADSVRVSLWNLERGDGKTDLVNLLNYNGLSRSPESLTEIIMCAEFHPKSCNIFAYGNCNGNVRLCDMRESSVRPRNIKMFDGSNTSRFLVDRDYNEVVNSIRHLKFSPSARYLMTRKYMSLEIWDLNMESKPIETYDVQEWIQPHLELVSEVYDRANDNFVCDWSFNEKRIVSGSYNNSVRIVDRSSSKSRMYKLHQANLAGIVGKSPPLRPRKVKEIQPTSRDYHDVLKKCVQISFFHPKENLIGLSTGPNLFLYSTSSSNKQLKAQKVNVLSA